MIDCAALLQILLRKGSKSMVMEYERRKVERIPETIDLD